MTQTESPEPQPVTTGAQMPDHAMMLAGVPARRFYWDAQTAVDAIADVTAYYGMDQLLFVTDIYNIEAEALGAKMVYGENSMPTIDVREPLVKSPDDLRRLKTPDFHRDGRFPYALECMRLSLERGVNIGWYCAPFSLAVGLRGYASLVRDMRRQPQFADELLTFIVDEVLTPYLKTQKEELGIQMSTGADAWCCVPNLSVEDMKQWVVPYNQRLMAKAREFGFMPIPFSGDYCEERIEKFDARVLYGCFEVASASVGMPVLPMAMGRWQDYPLEPVTQYLEQYTRQGIRLPLSVGINARLMHDGPVGTIIDTIKRFVNAFAMDHDLSIFMANIPADTPPEHVHAAVAAIHTYGARPIEQNLENIKFEVPVRESFEEWKAGRIS